MASSFDLTSRRRILVAGALAATLPGTAAAQNVPRDVGRKFNADGSVRRFGGNTFIGHVGQQGADYEQFDALLDIYREMPAHAFAHKIALTPPSSYHVTMFGGLNDEDQGRARWPRGLPPDMPVDAVTREWLRQLKTRPPLADHRFKFEFGNPALMKDGAPHVPLVPADDATARRLKGLRDELSAFTGLRDKDHERYRYHLTFGYLHAVLSDGEAQALKSATEDWVRRLSARVGAIAIPAVEFCSFRDMYAFRVLHEL